MMSLRTAVIAATLMTVAVVRGQPTPDWTAGIDHAARAAPGARIIIVDLRSGRILASHRLQEAARTLSAPGSTLKPLILYHLLASGQWDPERRVACGRTLEIAGHRLA